MLLRNVTKGRVAVEKLEIADTFISRFVGLMGRKSMPDDSGLMISNCNNIHMFFMCFPIDAVFIDREMRVAKIVGDLQPWRLAACRAAKHTLELPSGAAERCGIEVGDELEVVEHVRAADYAPTARQADQ